MTLLRCALLDGLPGVSHAFSTRVDPHGARFDVGRHDTVDDHALACRRRLLIAAGLGGDAVVLHQVHGARVAALGEAEPGAAPLEADGMWADLDAADGRVPCVRTADCVPLLLAEASGRFVAAVHAGWRGTAAGIAGEAVARLGSVGVDPSAVVAAIGPSVGPCCYEVGDEVLESVARACGRPADELRAAGPSGPARIDLGRANRLQLEASGVRAAAISRAPWCTACRPEQFFSYRADGGPTGSLMACIGRSAVA